MQNHFEVGQIEEWAKQFRYHSIAFAGSLKDFNSENLGKLFQHIYKSKCSENIDSMIEIFQDVLLTRTLYFQIKTTYYSNCEEVLIGQRDLLKSYISMDIESFCEDIGIISESIMDIYPFFYPVLALEKQKIKHNFKPGISIKCKDFYLQLNYKIQYLI